MVPSFSLRPDYPRAIKEISKVVKGIRKVNQKVVPLHNGFMNLLCNYLFDLEYFL